VFINNVLRCSIVVFTQTLTQIYIYVYTTKCEPCYFIKYLVILYSDEIWLVKFAITVHLLFSRITIFILHTKENTISFKVLPKSVLLLYAVTFSHFTFQCALNVILFHIAVKKKEITLQNTRNQSVNFHRQTTNYATVQFLCQSDIAVPLLPSALDGFGLR
jgi:hypothetical protein